MKRERPADIPQAEGEPAAATPSFEDQKFHLLDLQVKQGLDLETSGLADKARADLLGRVRESRARLAANGAEGVEVDLDADLSKDTDLTRVVAALDTRNDGDVRFAGVRFMTVEVDDKGKTWEGRAFIPVAMGSLEVGWKGFMPASGYTPEDVGIVTGLLEEVQADKTSGVLPDLADDLATINDPDGVMKISAAPSIMPRF